MFLRQRKQSGASMIEILVSLFVLAVGLLGVLGLQVNALASNQRAEFVTKAQIAASDMVGRILAYGDNAQGANNGEYVINTLTYSGSDPACITSGCPPADLVTHDKLYWQELLSVSLPGGQGIIEWNAPIYTITVLWDQDRMGARGTDCNSRDTETHLTCYQMELSL